MTRLFAMKCEAEQRTSCSSTRGSRYRVLTLLLIASALPTVPRFAFAETATAPTAEVQAEVQEEAASMDPDTDHPAEFLIPPTLPKLEVGEWKEKKTIFRDALSVEDFDGNDLDKVLDLPGTMYSAHVDLKPVDASGEDPVFQFTSAYEEELEKKSFDYRVKLPGSAYYVSGAADDSEDGGVYGQSVIAKGKLRFIAVRDNAGGNIDIFVSDAVDVSEMLAMISAKNPHKVKASGLTY